MALQTRSATWDTVDPRLPSTWPLARPCVPTVARVERDRVLVIEHQPVVGVDIAQAFEAEGAQVVGVASCADTALALIAEAGHLDGAVLDLDLRGGTAFSVADELARRGIPFLFLASGDADEVPERFAHVACCEKPVEADRIVPLLLGQSVRRDQSRALGPPRFAEGAGGKVSATGGQPPSPSRATCHRSAPSRGPRGSW